MVHLLLLLFGNGLIYLAKIEHKLLRVYFLEAGFMWYQHHVSSWTQVIIFQAWFLTTVPQNSSYYAEKLIYSDFNSLIRDLLH